ncbi:histidine kinase [Paenibacillus sp. J31TS4]|uniref:response regulator n=1 Tax=Paenibacillus sp. J31TS4 TaxID=2807195 RepID=UPI001B120476|nr:response regulator [Paenibacillus sp. J31TS4]GIP40045.1 histidine kinase [Paenibacillus sp. J31TS4]
MKIRTKLFLGFGALIFLMFALAGVGISRMTSLDDNIKELYGNRYTKVKLALNTRTEVYEISKSLVDLINASGDKTKINEEIKSRSDSATDMFSDLYKMTQETTDNTEEQLVQNIVKSGEKYLQYRDDVVRLVGEGRSSEANQLRQTTGLTIQETVHGQLEDLAKYEERMMDKEVKASQDNNQSSLMGTFAISIIGLLIGLAIMFWIIYSITGGLSTVSRMISSFAHGLVDARELAKVKTKDEIGEVAAAFTTMAIDLQEKTRRERELNRVNEEQNWLKTNLVQINTQLQGVNDLDKVCQRFVSEVTPMVGASYGAIYLLDNEQDDGLLTLTGSYAYKDGIRLNRSFRVGEGLVGQSVLDNETILLSDVPSDYIKINSGLGEISPVSLIVHPIRYEEEIIGVVEVASLNEFNPLQLHLLDQLCDNVGIMLNNLIGRKRVENLLQISQNLTEELQTQSEELLSQQEELRASNEKLEEKTKSLQRSEEMLQRQQEELEQSNDELMKKTQLLERHIWETEEVNRQIQKTKSELERQTLQLALTSKYKSEFMANMSHELRTPLNSLLILSQLLADNKEGNLTPKQVEFAGTIHSSGSDLLRLIDEILDLSKVEAGKMEVHPEEFPLREIEPFLRRNFMPIAKKSGVKFRVLFDENVPHRFYTDRHRLEQVLRNLLSNAFKFTKSGSVTVHARMTADHPLEEAQGTEALAISVIDTGIGIPEDKRMLIFEAFQQADGTTSRKYGGTGLGLSISRELARLLGGTIALESEEGKGSSFTLFLPSRPSPQEAEQQVWKEVAANQDLVEPADLSQEIIIPRMNLSDPTLLVPSEVEDDRYAIEPKDKVLLIIEDDVHFAKVILEMAQPRGFKVLVATQGDKGLALAQKYKPDAIILDIQLPVLDGWSILHHLKQNPDTRHIPVHVMSVIDDTQQGLNMGAFAYLRKPASRENLDDAFAHIQSFLDRSMKKLLIVEDDEELLHSLVELIGHEDVHITALTKGREALRELKHHHYDCMVLDLGLSDIGGFDLLETIREDENLKELPIIIYTGRDLDKNEERKLKKYAESIIIKNVKSPERLFDETALFLHRVEANLPEEKRQILEKLYSKEASFEGKSLLLVDDDIRNVFALSSVLEQYGMKVTFAENGVEALQLLESQQDIDLILMDIMMPEMDGYETMRRIREMPDWERIPIIALTAKAMKEDRNKCIEAGASDYITKPINTDQLLSLLKVWLYK